MFADAHIYLGVALAGLVSFLSPCVLPLVPPYLGYLGGATISQATADGIDSKVWWRVVIGSVFFVLGFTTVFVGLGAGASAFGQVIQAYKGPMSVVAGLVIMVFGLHFLGLVRIPLLYQEARYHAEVQGASYLGAYVLGLAFAFGWTPCIGPVLATVLTLAANEASLGAGVKLLLAYSAGLGVPFILAAIAIRPFLGFMKRFKRHLGAVEHVMGALLVLTGIMMLAGPVHNELAYRAPAALAAFQKIGMPLALIGLLLLLGTGGWVVRRVNGDGTMSVAVDTAGRAAGVVLLAVGLFIVGGSLNFLGQWLIENVPLLSQIEEWVTPKDLSRDIMKKGLGQ
ncbi:MAG: cytochrome c biogenesis protein CcdA [Hyphomicrobiaceae bacterium]